MVGTVRAVGTAQVRDGSHVSVGDTVTKVVGKLVHVPLVVSF